MGPSQDRIPSVGLHVLYEPDKSNNALVDIVFIHGFGGHPMRSWQYDNVRPGAKAKPGPPSRDIPARLLLKRTASSDKHRRPNTPGGALLRNNTWHSESKISQSVFWPQSLLPMSCPEARILTWGYHVLRNGNLLVPAQPDLFTHAREFLGGLRDIRSATSAQQRPLVLIAHSIGGIIVKEALHRAEFSSLKSEQDILSSVTAVIFFGCPHHGVKETSLAEIVLSMAEETLGIATVRPVLSDLCNVKNAKWSESRDSFLRLWNHFNFQVKTYQEAGSSTDQLINARSASSRLGHASEDAEILLADHDTMCRFRSEADQGFRSLLHVLQEVVRRERTMCRRLTKREEQCLQGLDYKPIGDIPEPTIGSFLRACRRISNTSEFVNWYRRQDASNERVLWLTGGPGTGKSTQLQHVWCRMVKQWNQHTTSVVFCTAEGESLDRVFVSEEKLGKQRSVTAIRSILAQLFTQDPALRRDLSSLFNDTIGDADLVRFFLDNYIKTRRETSARRTFILIDAKDNCDEVYIEELLNCLCQLAQNSSFSVCLASQPVAGHIPENLTQLSLEEHNLDDIERLIESHLKADWDERPVLVRKVADKSGGSFSWAQLATNLLNGIIEGGGAQDLVNQVLCEFPTDLYELYQWALGTFSREEKADTAIIMRWVMLSSEPMTLSDLRMAIQLSGESFLPCGDPHAALNVGIPQSMQELQRNGKHFDTPLQFYHWLRSRTCGLLEARPTVDGEKVQQSLGLQQIHPIHESVRLFFLSGRGFAALSSAQTRTGPAGHAIVDRCHYSLLRTILLYLNTSDLSPLVSGQRSPEPEPGHLSDERSPTWRKNVVDQRNLIMSSYPFLRYAVYNLLHHLLSPRSVRYFPPQQTIFEAFSSNDCRIWRRWTALLGETDASAVLAASKSAEEFLQPEFGTVFRLERVFRVVKRTAMGESWFSPYRSLTLRVSHTRELEEAERSEVQRDRKHQPKQKLKVVLKAGNPSLLCTAPRGARSRGTVIAVRRR